MRLESVFAVLQALASLRGRAGAKATSPPAEVTAFINVSVIPMDTERLLTRQTVLIRNGRIVAVAPSGRVTIPAGATRIDGRGEYLMPGLADMHVHFRLARDSMQLEHLLLRWLADGLVALRNMDRSNEKEGALALWAKAKVEAGKLSGPHIYTAGPWGPAQYRMAGLPDPADGHFQPPPSHLDSIASYVAAYKAAGYDFIKPYHESPLVLDSLMAAARRVGIPVAGHVPLNEGVVLEQAFRGYASIEHLMGYQDAVKRTGTSMAQLAATTRRAGIWNCPTQAVFLGFLDTTLMANKLKLDSFEVMIKTLHDSGAGLLLGSDDMEPRERGSDGVGQVHHELRLMVRAGLTPYQALRTGTTNVAAFLGRSNEAGAVTVGKRADLVLLSENPLVTIRTTAQPIGVMVGGRWLPRAELDRRLAEIEK